MVSLVKYIRDFFDFVRHLLNPIIRRRYLYGNRWGWIWFSILITCAILFILWSISCILDVSAVEILDISDGRENTFNLFLSILSQFADPGNIPLSSRGKGLIISVICALLGVVCLSGLLVSSLINMISIKSNEWKKGLVIYNGFLSRHYFLNNFVVIIGYNEQTATIVKSSRRKKDVKYVIIQTNRDVEEIRMKLNLLLDEEDEKRVIFYHGERTSYEDIAKLRIEDACEIYILGEDMHSPNEQDHDAYNMTCLEHIAKYMGDNPMKRTSWNGQKKQNMLRLKCHVNFEYQSTFMAFKFTHIYKSLNDKIEFLPFNVHELWAKKILVDNYAIIQSDKNAEKQVIQYYPLEQYYTSDRQPAFINESSDLSVHLVILGMNQMGVALAMQAAILEHLPNFHSKHHKPRTTITFIDDHAIKEGEYLMGRYAALFELCRHRTIDTRDYIFNQYDYTSAENPSDILWQKKDFHPTASFDDKGKWCNWIDPMEIFANRFSYLSIKEDTEESSFEQEHNFMDLQWEFIEGDVASESIRNYLSRLVNDTKHRTTTIAICFNNPQLSIAAALYLPETVLKRALQILVYQQNSFDMINKISTSEKEWKRYAKLRPFGMIEGCYSGETFDNLLAKFTNLIYTDETLRPDTALTKEMSERATRMWEELGIVDKLANIDLVDSFGLKDRTGATNSSEMVGEGGQDPWAEAEHSRWIAERLTMGYRPLEPEELNKLVNDNNPLYRKDYFKDKSRAHIDICATGQIKKWDEPTYNKHNDRRIINMISTIRHWQQIVIRSEIQSRSIIDKKNDTISQMISDMEEVEGFCISSQPITIGQWETIMGICPQKLKSKKKNEPITFVSYDDIQKFLTILQRESCLTFTLPTKNIWEKAAKQLKHYDNEIWQWVADNGDEYKSSKMFCGPSKLFKDSDWQGNYSYWLPNFTSSDLGFRVVLPSLSKEVESYSKESFNDVIGAKRVIDDMTKNMIAIGNIYVMPTPVTQGQWKAVMLLRKRLNGKSKGISDEQDNPSEHRGDNYPVENVSFNDIQQKFINTLNQTYVSSYRLPTNQEWQDIQQNDCARQDIIWCSDNAKSTHRLPLTLEEGKIYDMLGNVWEWCNDSPEGDKGQICRVLQGGSWRFTEDECKGIKRDGSKDPSGSYWLPDYKADDLGFRLVMDCEEYKELLLKINVTDAP